VETKQTDGHEENEPPDARRRVEVPAMQAVMAAERALGFEPTDVSADNRGYDLESRVPGTGKLRFLEVKGRAVGAETITVTRNEIMTALDKPEDFILAIATVDASVGPAGGAVANLRYVREPFQREPDFAVTSVNYALLDLLQRSGRRAKHSAYAFRTRAARADGGLESDRVERTEAANDMDKFCIAACCFANDFPSIASPDISSWESTTRAESARPPWSITWPGCTPRWGGAVIFARWWMTPRPGRTCSRPRSSRRRNGSGSSRSARNSCSGRTPRTRSCSKPRATRSGRAGAAAARRTPAIHERTSCSTATNCPPPTIPSPEPPQRVGARAAAGGPPVTEGRGGAGPSVVASPADRRRWRGGAGAGSQPLERAKEVPVVTAELRVAGGDLSGRREATSPGDALRELFKEYGPCLILIDEWVACARQLHDQSDLPAGGSRPSSVCLGADRVGETGGQLSAGDLAARVGHAGSPHTQADDVEVAACVGARH